MDVEFMVTDSLEAIRPKMALLKNIEDAVSAVDEMFASTVQGSGRGYLRLLVRRVILIPT
jgi:regulator of nonsense transcripts 2